MKLTTIQIQEDTKKKLEMKKIHPRESYDSVVKRVLEEESMPTMEDMFRKVDSLKQSRKYSTKEVIELSHELRGKR